MGRRETGPHQAVHRTIVVVDVSGYGDARRTSGHRLVLRQALYQALRRAFADSGVPWKDCRHVDCGDGVLVLVPPGIPEWPAHPRGRPRRVRRYGPADPFRLPEAAQVKAALLSAPTPLALITSAWFHGEVVRRTPSIGATPSKLR